MAEPIGIQQLKDASLDVKSLEEVVNGDENVVVTSRLGETYPSVKGSIKTLFESGGLPATPFTTRALMTASALVDGDYALVTDDTVNNGLYAKTAGTWVKSAYDPLTQAKSYADANPLFKPAKLIAGDDLNLLDAGIYYTNTQDILNMPPLTHSIKAGLVEVIRDRGSAYQKYYHYASLEQWERAGNGSSSNLQYFAWTKVIKQSDIENSASDAIAEAVNQSTTYTDGTTYQDKGRLTTEHLDTLLSRGIWVSNSSVNATLVNGYPWEGVPCVITNYKTSSTPTILQTAQSIEATRKRTATRRHNGTSWGQWNKHESVELAALDNDVKNRITSRAEWLFPDDNVVSFDNTTRILSWNRTIMCLSSAVSQNRINFNSASISLENAPDYSVVYLDLTLVPQDGSSVTDPTTCIKVGNYNVFKDDINRIPLVKIRENDGKAVSCSGFPPVINTTEGGGDEDISNNTSPTIAFDKTETALTFYTEGANSNLIKNQLVHTVNPDIQLDNWGMTTAMEVDADLNNVKAITSNGVWECALKDSENASDHSGGSHGDELKTSAFFLVDGVYKAEDFVLSGKAKEIKFVQKSVIYAQESQVKIADRQVEWTFSFDKLNIKQTVTPVAGRTFSSTWILMLPVLRKSNANNTGTQITDREVRNTDFTVIDVSEPDFERREQVANEGDFINLSGQVSGISATVKVNHINSPNPMHFVQNNIQFNKIYLAARTINTSALIAEEETWSVDADIIIKTIN